MKKYRIKELNGRFTIEIKTKVKTGRFYNRDVKYVWENVNAFGYPYKNDGVRDLLCPTFKSLESAKVYIDNWNHGKSKAIYHNPDDVLIIPKTKPEQRERR